jgi:hypothetical protein
MIEVVRAKFVLSKISLVNWSKDARILEFSAQYDTAIPEDQRFAKATPSGTFTMQCDNPAANDRFELGKAYYFDITAA